MFGLDERVVKLMTDLFATYPQILQVRVYGSRALGNYKPASDIDLAVMTGIDDDITPRLKTALNDLPTPYLFDVTDYNRITHLPLKEHIDKYSKLLYDKQ